MSPTLEQSILGLRDRAQDRILRLSHDLHQNPEIAWEEHESAARVAGELDDAGFTVESNYVGLATAFRAHRGSGPLHLALCAEYDALPGLGHACGHNVIAAISTGAALALGPFVDDLGITLSVFGTPAEEGGGGKIEMLDRGAFTGVHAAAMVHPGPVDVARAEPYAVSHSHIAYDGKAAHAAAYPDRGINAADAFTIAQVAIGLLRQQLPSDVRVHGMMTRGGEAPNAIPQRTEGRWYVRAQTLGQLEELEPRVLRCFAAGALATGCELTIEPESKPYSEFRNDEHLLDRVQTAGRTARPPILHRCGQFDEPCVDGHGQRLAGHPGHPSLHRDRLAARGQPPARVRRRGRVPGSGPRDDARRTRPCAGRCWTSPPTSRPDND